MSLQYREMTIQKYWVQVFDCGISKKLKTLRILFKSNTKTNPTARSNVIIARNLHKQWILYSKFFFYSSLINSLEKIASLKGEERFFLWNIIKVSRYPRSTRFKRFLRTDTKVSSPWKTRGCWLFCSSRRVYRNLDNFLFFLNFSFILSMTIEYLKKQMK